ncbi:hypothetical protein NDI56_15880 [Haloarcula sp. S1CR25-12]|uniref:50S ribosomal protein L31e n=1 Tax=Haloarcula saliterrae TaxID=2950534 RepID=A0ABU2FGP9_9EURY|nr:hypothetical protein [Haloarcula sp. S1CR25-12]MDS0260885.1 hypothetical protein [Haloarcula sp. S1CR25-12]
MEDSSDPQSDTVAPSYSRMQVRPRVKSNLMEIARWLDDRYEQDLRSRDAALELVTEQFITDHSDDFDNKGQRMWVYTGRYSGETKEVTLDCGKTMTVAVKDDDSTNADSQSEQTDDDGDDSDDGKLTFTLSDGPTGGEA